MPKEEGYRNLKPIQSKDEARARGRKGGIASGKARREKKTAREYAIAALEAETTDSSGKKVVIKDAMIQKLIVRAISETDLNAIKYILELIGDAPSQKIEVTGKDGSDLMKTEISKEEAKKLVAELGAEFGWDMTNG